MSQEKRQQQPRKTDEKVEKVLEIPKRQRAMIFQGGGALGAYEAGVYRVLYDWIYKNLEKDSEGKDENLFDVIAGTSIGALNGAIILSHILEKRKADPNRSQKLRHYWHGSAQ